MVTNTDSDSHGRGGRDSPFNDRSKGDGHAKRSGIRGVTEISDCHVRSSPALLLSYQGPFPITPISLCLNQNQGSGRQNHIIVSTSDAVTEGLSTRFGSRGKEPGIY